MFVFGFIGYIMEKIEMPVSPVVLGIILGPMFEAQFRLGLTMFFGDFSVFFTRPISLVFVTFAIISLAIPFIKKYVGYLSSRKA
jgi:putative tricarboxylic transport membrane protein